jgi:hypothetical protein
MADMGYVLSHKQCLPIVKYNVYATLLVAASIDVNVFEAKLET